MLTRRFDACLTPNRLRERFPLMDRFRVSEFNYPAGTVFNGSMIAGKCFVFAGAVTYHYDGFDVYLTEGEWAELPAGNYQLTVGRACDANLVCVWEITRF